MTPLRPPVSDRAGTADPATSDLADDPVYQSIASVASLHVQAEQGIDPHQRLAERLVRLLGRPGFFYFVFVVGLLWMLGNTVGHGMGYAVWDVPPFFWLQGTAGASAFLLAILILTTQNRQARLAERRAQLDLQINLLTEQKVAKLIGLIEELRRDLPIVHNRHDAEAVAMTESANPAEVLSALEETLDEAQQEAGENPAQ